jgi:peptidoglycan DL-endopeptidase CwlO
MATDTKVYAAGAAAIGIAFVYSALKGKSFLSVLQGTIKGKNPKTIPVTQNITATNLTGALSSVTSISAGAAGSGISADAIKYVGAGYVWGGAPAKGVGNWDCSSFTNWVCGHDLGLPIPGHAAGTYDGSSHGPPTDVWLLWGGLKFVSHSSADAQPGDLCIWQTHMGIALGNGQMISALNSDKGTLVTSIDGIVPGELLYVRRYP